MCVIERKTYIHSGGRREVIETHRRCHNAPNKGLCSYVEQRNVDVARIVEVRPSSSRTSPSRGDIITTGTRRHQTITRRNSTRIPSGPSSVSSARSPADSLSPPPPQPTYKEVRPRAPTPPPTLTVYPPARHSETTPSASPTIPNVTISPGGTAVYDRPPSLGLSRAEMNERRSLSRPSSISSTTAEVEEREPSNPARRRVSFRQRRPSNVTIDVAAALADIEATTKRSSPGLSNLPHPFADTMPRDTGKPRARVDSASDGLRHQQQQEDERQARLAIDKMAEAEHRQHERLRKAEAAAEEARRRAAKTQIDGAESSSSAERRKTRERRKAAAALEGQEQQQARREAEMERKVNAELVQIARERADAEARKRDSADWQQPQSPFQPVRPRTMSPRTSTLPAYPTLGSPAISARTLTPLSPSTPFPSARRPAYPIIVHNPGLSARKNSLSERGEAVIAREQARAITAAQRMNAAVANWDVEAAIEDDNLDAAMSASMRRTASRRLSREVKDREREREGRRERERRLRDEGYF